MKLTTFYVPEFLLEALDGLVERGMYPHRAEAIRVAVRDLVREEGCLPRAKFLEESAENLTLAMRTDETREKEASE